MVFNSGELRDSPQAALVYRFQYCSLYSVQPTGLQQIISVLNSFRLSLSLSVSRGGAIIVVLCTFHNPTDDSEEIQIIFFSD